METDKPRLVSEPLTDDEERGERSMEGWGDHDERRNPIVPAPHDGIGDEVLEREDGRQRGDADA